MTDPRITKEMIKAAESAMEEARWPEGMWAGGSVEPPETEPSVWLRAALEAVFALLLEPEWEYCVNDRDGDVHRLVREPAPVTVEDVARVLRLTPGWAAHSVAEDLLARFTITERKEQ